MTTRYVDFYFGPGSRYSYLASTQLDGIAARTGAHFRWRPTFSPDLMRAAGLPTLADRPQTGQYDRTYRDRDTLRWAALYGVAFSDPDVDFEQWRRISHALVAAGDLVEALARIFFIASFAQGDPPRDDDALARLAARVGIDDLLARLDAPDIEARAGAIVEEAVAAGAFGVPSFVADGALFWGNDRLVLLEHHLMTR
jgi:2-hydroxychromene-2-carboxylate isomerase